MERGSSSSLVLSLNCTAMALDIVHFMLLLHHHPHFQIVCQIPVTHLAHNKQTMCVLPVSEPDKLYNSKVFSE